MARNQAFDSFEIAPFILPYAPNIGKLSNKPVLTDGLNGYITWGGTFSKRPGTNRFGSTTAITVYPVRLWLYKTLETTPVYWIVGSFKNGSVYELRYQKLSPSSGNWTVATARRGCNNSQYPHEAIVRRGKLYVKGFPNSTDDTSKLGCVVLDGTGGTMTTHDWGAIGPTVPAALSSPAGWSASANPVTVRNEWIYVYTWVLASGQETNHSPLQTNPDKDPSSTGAFTNKRPSMTVQGHADTTEYPYINIYRTTDGGGTFFFLKQIANTGAGNITFEDKYLESGAGGGTFQDPLPDQYLDTFRPAPFTLRNSPPPATVPPNVTGTDTLLRSTPIEQYAGRLWYAINEYVFYSALEELEEGVPEESWPSGTYLPNFFRMPDTVVNLISTPDGLLVITNTETLRIQSTNKATFNPRPFLGGIGGAYNQPRAVARVGENVAWLTQDYRIAVVNGDNYADISKPLGSSIKTLVDAGAEIQILFWSQGDKEWLIVAAHRADDTTATRWLIYDLERARTSQEDFWFVPWSVPSTAAVSGQSASTSTQNYLLAQLWNNTNSQLVNFDFFNGTYSDPDPTTGTGTGYEWSLRTALMTIPAGNHVNNLRRPDFSPTVASLAYTKTDYTGDQPPTVYLYKDNFFTTPITLEAPTYPPRREEEPSNGYTTLIYNRNLWINAKYAAFKLSAEADTLGAEINTLVVSWLPESGA